MEYSNEFLARVYGAYIGCELKYYIGFGEYDKDYGILKGVVVKEELCKVYHTALSSNTVSVFNKENLERKPILLLTPLSAITDEHAIEVAKICYPFTSGYTNELRMGKRIISILVDVGNINMSFFTQTRLKDKLREWGYDIGYAEIPSLIDAGLAIDKTTLNN